VTSPEDEEAYRDLFSSQRTNFPKRSHNTVLISIWQSIQPIRGSIVILDYGNTMQGTKKLLASKVTSKFQTTIPQAIRSAMGISQGDVVVFEIDEDRVFIKKLPPLDLDYLNAISGTLSEWTSPEDEEAYRDL